MATILIRNTLDTSMSNMMSGYLRDGVTGNGPVLLTMWKIGQTVPNKVYSNTNMPPSGIHYLAPGTQHKYLSPLYVGSNLTGGVYFVHASVMAFAGKWISADGAKISREQPQIPMRKDLLHANGTGEWVEVKSADVPIKIIGAP